MRMWIISAPFGGKPLEALVRALGEHEVYLSLTIEQELEGVISGLSKKLTKEQILFTREKFQQLLRISETYFHLNPCRFIKGC